MSGIIKTVSRFNAIVLLSALVTLLQFYVMQLLVSGDDTIPQQIHKRLINDITMPEWEPVINRPSPRPEKPEDPPELPARLIIGAGDKTIAIGPVPLPKASPGGKDENFHFGPIDGNAVPIAQIQPAYPTRALERGVEGFVIVEFDVSEAGTVINPRVLGAVPEGIFDSAALRAIERWKYNPKIVDGKAVKMTGLQTRFTFSLRE